MELHVFDASGGHLTRLPGVAKVSYSHSLSEEGSMSLTVADGDALRRLDLSRVMREYGSIWVLVDGSLVRHAGWLTHAKVADDGLSVDVTTGDGWSLFDRRLVVPKALADRWVDGDVVIDEDHPPGDWVLDLTGSYRDICRGLVAEALKHGAAPYALPAVQGGEAHTCSYNAWELATVADRLSDVADLDDGPEIRFDPSLDADGGLSWLLHVGDPEIVDHDWTWNLAAPGQHVLLTGLDVDGAGLCNQAYAVGGRTDDRLLVARSVGTSMTGRGWPVLQAADTSHGTVVVEDTLKGYANAAVATGDRPQVTLGLQVPASLDVRVGDWAELVVPDRWPGGAPPLQALLMRSILTGQSWPLKITNVDWDVQNGMQSLQCRVRS